MSNMKKTKNEILMVALGVKHFTSLEMWQREQLYYAMDEWATQHKSAQLQQHGVMQAEGSDVSEGAAVGQRSVDTVAVGRTCDKYCTGPWDCQCQDVLDAFYRKDAGSSHEGQP